MKKIATALVLLMSASSCTKGTSPGCAIQGGVDFILAPTIATTLQCTNSPAIMQSLADVGAKIGLCKPVPAPSPSPAPGSLAVQGGIVSGLCTALGGALISQIGNAIPAAWGCSPTIAVGGLQLAITTACALIPVAAVPGAPILAK